MDIKKGDWVRTERGVTGKVMLVSRVSAYIEVDSADGQGQQVRNYALSFLTKIDAPADKRTSK